MSNTKTSALLKRAGALFAIPATALLAFTGPATASAAPAPEVGPLGYWQTCSDIGNFPVTGRLCIDGSGDAAGQGTISVGWWQNSAAYQSIKLCWNSGGNKFCEPDWHVVGGGGSHQFSWPTYLGRGCNASPEILVGKASGGWDAAPGYPLCVA